MYTFSFSDVCTVYIWCCEYVTFLCGSSFASCIHFHLVMSALCISGAVNMLRFCVEVLLLHVYIFI